MSKDIAKTDQRQTKDRPKTDQRTSFSGIVKTLFYPFGTTYGTGSQPMDWDRLGEGWGEARQGSPGSLLSYESG